MTEAGGGDQLPAKGGDKLQKANRRCVNKDCREVLSLATKVSAPGDGPAPGLCAAAAVAAARPPAAGTFASSLLPAHLLHSALHCTSRPAKSATLCSLSAGLRRRCVVFHVFHIGEMCFILD